MKPLLAVREVSKLVRQYPVSTLSTDRGRYVSKLVRQYAALQPLTLVLKQFLVSTRSTR